MTEKNIKSGSEIVKDFIHELKKDTSLDKSTVEIIEQLHLEKKLTQTKLQQALALKRKESDPLG